MKAFKKIAMEQGDDYTVGCLPNYPFYKENFKLIAVDLSKEQTLIAYPKSM